MLYRLHSIAQTLERNGLAIVDLEVIEPLVLHPIVRVIAVLVAAVQAAAVYDVTVLLTAFQNRICPLVNLLVLLGHQVSGCDTCLKLKYKGIDGVPNVVVSECL